MAVRNGDPKPLTPRHMLMAYLVAAGKKPIEIARQLGYTPARVNVIAQSPLFKVLVADLQRDLRESTISAITDRITSEAVPSLDTIVELRDHAENENVRLGAANSLLDRGPLPKKSHIEGEHKFLNVTVGAGELRQMLKAVAEADGLSVQAIDVTPRAIEGSEHDQSVLRTIDEAVAVLEAEEAYS